MKYKIIHGLLLLSCIFCLAFAAIPSLLYFIWNVGVLALYGIGITLLLLIKFSHPVWAWLKKHKWLFRSGVLILAIAFSFFCYANLLLFSYAYQKQPTDANAKDTVVVLGCQIIGDQPSLSLRKRLDKAAEFLLLHPEANCIVTGGVGKGKQYSEAEIMKRYLTEHGIDANRIYSEEHSTGTRENLRYAMQIAQKHQLSTDVIIVSDNYHQYRAAVYLKRDFSKTAAHLSSSGPWGIVPCYWLREILGVFYLFMEGR